MSTFDVAAGRRGRRRGGRRGVRGRLRESHRVREALFLAAALFLALLLAAMVAQGAAAMALALVLLPSLAIGAVAVFTDASRATLAVVALLCVHPALRLSFGPVPVYVLDVAVVGALLAVVRTRPRFGTYGLLVGVYVLAWVPALLLQLGAMPLLLEPTYALLRNTVAVGVFFIGHWIFTTPHRERVLRWIAGGTAITSFIAVLQAAPGTKGAIATFLQTVAPAAAEGGYRVYPNRAFAFFFAPTTLSGFLAIAAILVATAATQATGRTRRLLFLAAAGAGPALVATYSRQWLPALVVGVFVLAVCRPRLGGRALVAIGLAAIIAFAALSGGLVDREYLNERYSRLSLNDPNVQARLERQEAFFETLDVTNPRSFFGHGLGIRDIVDRRLVGGLEAQELERGASENAFFFIVYERGFIAGFLYVALLFGALAMGIRAARRDRGPTALAAGLTAALATAMTLHWFDPYFGDSVFMQAFLWLLVGMLVGLARSTAGPAGQRSRSSVA